MYDIDYLTGDLLNKFFDRYKLKYNDNKFGIDLFDDVEEEKEIVGQSSSPVFVTPTPAKISGNGQTGNITMQSMPDADTKILLDYLDEKHSENEYPDINTVLEYLGISTDGIKTKKTASSRLNTLFKMIKKYKTTKIKKGFTSLNNILVNQIDSIEEFREYMDETIYKLMGIITENPEYSDNTAQNNFDIEKLKELCEDNRYNFIGPNNFETTDPEHNDVFIDQLYDNMPYVVQEYDSDIGLYVAREINPKTLEIINDGRVTIFYADTNSFEEDRTPGLYNDYDENDSSGWGEPIYEEEEEELPENIPLPDDDYEELPENIPLPDSDDDEPEQKGEGFKNIKFKKQNKNLVLLLKELGYKIK
jgi:hypothetical protein